MKLKSTFFTRSKSKRKEHWLIRQKASATPSLKVCVYPVGHTHSLQHHFHHCALNCIFLQQHQLALNTNRGTSESGSGAENADEDRRVKEGKVTRGAAPFCFPPLQWQEVNLRCGPPTSCQLSPQTVRQLQHLHWPPASVQVHLCAPSCRSTFSLKNVWLSHCVCGIHCIFSDPEWSTPRLVNSCVISGTRPLWLKCGFIGRMELGAQRLWEFAAMLYLSFAPGGLPPESCSRRLQTEIREIREGRGGGRVLQQWIWDVGLCGLTSRQLGDPWVM